MRVDFSKMEFSYHCKAERKERIEFIKNEIGFGQPLKELFYNDAYHYITDTGVAILVDGGKQKIITLYLIDAREATRAFCGKIPKQLHRKIDYHYSKGWIRRTSYEENI